MEADAGAQLTALGLPAAYLEGAAVGELGRVGEDGGSAVQVHTAAGTEWALLSGRARDAADRPVVGDWVELSRTADRPVVVRTLPRRTAVRRMSLHLDGREQALAANVDVVFVCFPAARSARTSSSRCWASRCPAAPRRCWS